MLFDGTVLRAEYSNPSVATIRSYNIIKENWLPRDMGIVAIGAHHRATVSYTFVLDYVEKNILFYFLPTPICVVSQFL